QRHQQVALISDVLLQCFLFVCFQKLTVFVFYLLFKCQTAVEDLQEKLERLRALADGLERVHEGTTIGSLAGGVIGAVGGITSIVGLVLAPFTLGASLIVTGVGVGVGVVGGVTAGASNITNMVNQSSDRKAVRSIIKEIEKKISAENLRRVGVRAGRGLGGIAELVRLVRVANIGQLAAQTSRAVRVAEVATGVLSGLFVAVDIFFIAMDAKEIHHIKEAREFSNHCLDDIEENKYILKRLYKCLVLCAAAFVISYKYLS
uniref:Uncharacterized protein n=1 Tax=Poecilia latipinna TaxID=48699 RepID=A0A3B3VCH8_9TELE